MSADAPPLTPDVAVPQRDALLDADAMAERLARLLGGHRPLAIESCRRERARYGVGSRLWVVYRVGVAGREHRVVAYTFADARAASALYAQARRAAPPANGMRPAVRDAELGAVVWTFPYDPGMPTLPALVDGREIVAYRPRRRAVVRCLDGAGAVAGYAKLFHDDRGAAVARLQEQLVARLDGDTILGVPRVLAFDPGRRTLLAEALPGPAGFALSGERLEWGVGRLGAALGRLHSLEPDALLPVCAPSERDVRDLLAPVVLLRPDARLDAAHLLAVLLDRLPRHRGPLAMTHGDVNENNAHVDGKRIALIDLDGLALRPAATDLGRVIAELRVDALRGRRDPDEVRALEGALLAGYASVRRLPGDEALRCHTALELAGVAARSLTRLSAKFARILPDVLGAAQEALG